MRQLLQPEAYRAKPLVLGRARRRPTLSRSSTSRSGKCALTMPSTVRRSSSDGTEPRRRMTGFDARGGPHIGVRTERRSSRRPVHSRCPSRAARRATPAWREPGPRRSLRARQARRSAQASDEAKRAARPEFRAVEFSSFMTRHHWLGRLLFPNRSIPLSCRGVASKAQAGSRRGGSNCRAMAPSPR